MALYTTTGAGNWSGAIWSPAAPAGGPAAGDQAVLAHAVTYDSAAGGSANGNGIIGRGAGTSLAGTGTINLVSSSTTVTGTGTSFLSQLNVGDMFKGGASFFVVITAIASDTSMTVGAAISVTAGASFVYTPSAIYLKSTGTLTLASGTTLTYRGDIPVTGTGSYSDRIILSAGSTLEHDSSTSPSASTCSYSVWMSTSNSQFPKFRTNGTINSPCEVRSNAGGAYGNITSGGWIGGGNVNATWTTFKRLGNSTIGGGLIIYPTNSALSELTLANCTFDTVQTITFNTTISALTNISLSGCEWRNSPTTCITFSTGTASAGLRVISKSAFDKLVNFQPFTGWSFSETWFNGNFSATGTAAPVLNQYNVVVFSGTANNQTILGNCLNNYYLFDASLDNPHGVGSGDLDSAFDGVIFDCMNMSANGDMILTGTATSLRQVPVKRCLVLPNLNGWGPGTLVSLIATNFQYAVEHNTVTSTATNENGIAKYGESYAGRANLYSSVQGNISYTPTGKDSAPKFMRTNQSTVGDVISVDGSSNVLCGHNGANNPILAPTGIYKTVFGANGGYVDTFTTPTTPMFSSVTGLGAGDVTGDPEFVDPTRNYATFDSAYLGNPPSAWQASHAYAVGDFVSVTGQTTMYGGATVNFRCILAHTSGIAGDGSSGKPGNSWSQQTLTTTGTPSSGTFTVTYYPSTGALGTATSALQWNASAATIATAVQTAAATAGDSITVTGSGGPYQTAPVLLTYTSGGSPFFTPGLIQPLGSSSLGGGATAVVQNWRTYWELATHYRMRQSVAIAYNASVAQATPKDLIYWLYAGFRPTNSAYNNVPFTGDTATLDAAGNALGNAIGAMAWVAPTPTPTPTPTGTTPGGSYGGVISGIAGRPMMRPRRRPGR